MHAGLGPEAEAVLAGLSRSRVRGVLSRLAQDPSIPPALEPLLPALAETVLFWSGGRQRVLVIHDEQSALTPGRLRRLQEVLADGVVLKSQACLVASRKERDAKAAALVAEISAKVRAVVGG